MHTMISNYKEGFYTKAISEIVKLIRYSKGSYTFESLFQDVQKIFSFAQNNQIKNIVYLLCEINVIKQSGLKLSLNKGISENKIKELIRQKIDDDGVLELLASFITVSDDAEWIAPIDLYHAGYGGVLNLLIYIGLVTRKSNHFKLNKNENLIKRYLIKSPEQLKVEIKAQEERGEIAEEYVLNLELERLKKHPQLQEIKRTSLEDVKAGYDIQSFKSLESTSIDRFIEVKSFKERNERFFWSINEIKKSAILKNGYILFIVNYSKINDKDYTCREISNPYEVFKMEQYIKEINDEKFKIEPQNFLISGII